MERISWKKARIDNVLTVLLIVLALGVLSVSAVEVSIDPTQATVATQSRA